MAAVRAIGRADEREPPGMHPKSGPGRSLAVPKVIEHVLVGGEDRAGQIVEREPGQANRLDPVLRQPPLDRGGREHDDDGLDNIPVCIGVCFARVDA